jgi:hypothetical protein
VTAGPIAGALIIASAVLIVATLAIWSTGGTVGLGTIGVPQPGGVALLGAIVLGIGGFAMTGFIGPRPLDRRITRAGFLIVAVGLTAILISSLISATLSYDPLESWPAVISLLVGLLGLTIGVPLFLGGLLATRGAARRLALVFLGGLGLVAIGSNVVLSLLMAGAIPDDRRLLYVAGLAGLVVGGASMIAAFAGVGWLAAVAGRGSAAAPRPSA